MLSFTTARSTPYAGWPSSGRKSCDSAGVCGSACWGRARGAAIVAMREAVGAARRERPGRARYLAWIWFGPQPVLLVASEVASMPRWEKR